MNGDGDGVQVCTQIVDEPVSSITVRCSSLERPCDLSRIPGTGKHGCDPESDQLKPYRRWYVALMECGDSLLNGVKRRGDV